MKKLKTKKYKIVTKAMAMQPYFDSDSVIHYIWILMYIDIILMVLPLGIEPRYRGPKPRVVPLDHAPISYVVGRLCSCR